MVSILNIFTIINLTLLGGILFFGKKANLANKILGIVIIIPATTFTVNYFIYTGFIKEHPWLVFINMNMLWAPMVLWYVLLTLGHTIKITWLHALHLIPFLFLILANLYLVSHDKKYISEFFNNVFNGKFPLAIILANALLLIQAFSYLTYAYYKINKEIRIYSSESKSEHPYPSQFKWVKFFILIIISLNVMAMILYSIFPSDDVGYIYNPLLYDIVFYMVIGGSVVNSNFLSVIELKKFLSDGSQIRINPFTKIDTQEVLFRIKEVMEKEKPFLNPEFTLNDLSVKLNQSAHLVSYCINQISGKNFSDFINQYRIEHSINMLKDPSASGFSMDGVGLECGFGSPASFYRSFKKITGFTPSQLLKLKEQQKQP